MLWHLSAVSSQHLSSNSFFAMLSSANRDLIAWRVAGPRLGLSACPGQPWWLLQGLSSRCLCHTAGLGCPDLTARVKSGERLLSTVGQVGLKVFMVCLKQNMYFMRSSCRISQFGILWWCSINFHPFLSCTCLI